MNKACDRADTIVVSSGEETFLNAEKKREREKRKNTVAFIYSHALNAAKILMM